MRAFLRFDRRHFEKIGEERGAVIKRHAAKVERQLVYIDEGIRTGGACRALGNRTLAIRLGQKSLET